MGCRCHSALPFAAVSLLKLRRHESEAQVVGMRCARWEGFRYGRFGVPADCHVQPFIGGLRPWGFRSLGSRALAAATHVAGTAPQCRVASWVVGVLQCLFCVTLDG